MILAATSQVSEVSEVMLHIRSHMTKLNIEHMGPMKVHGAMGCPGGHLGHSDTLPPLAAIVAHPLTPLSST